VNETFRTQLKIQESKVKIDYGSKCLFMGSCFTENIGNQLNKLKFSVDINPFGASYNPVSVKNSLNILLNKRLFTENDLSFYNGLWFSYYHHSNFSNQSKEECLQKINNRIAGSADFIESADFLFITFGTSYIFEFKKTNEVVSNCHKIPSENFVRRMVSAEEITSLYRPLLKNLLVINPKLKIIFSVSPIRHLNDGADGNMLSKATLIVAVHQIRTLFPDVGYFPAFEIVMDDLRDYRFYAEDMAHPNETAIKYIWNRFAETYVSQKALEISKKLEKIIISAKHRPFDVKSIAHQKFIKNTLRKIELLEKEYGQLQLDAEKEFFQSQLL
jgi:hypothetical protein